MAVSADISTFGSRRRSQNQISNGAAIAVRMAFQFPELLSCVGLLSGGLAEGEGERFDGWLARTPPEHWLRVRIDVGEQDAIIRLTPNLFWLAVGWAY